MFGCTVAPTRVTSPASCRAESRAMTIASLVLERVGHGCEGPRDQRQVALELVEQPPVERIEALHHVHSPVRCARAVKKMPDGLWASISPICRKLWVS